MLKKFKEKQLEIRNRIPRLAVVSDDFNEAYRAVDDLNHGTKVFGIVNCTVAVGQAMLVGALSETVIKAPLATAVLAKAADNIVAGAKTFITGKDTPTILYQAAQGIGCSDMAATALDAGLDIGLPVGSSLFNGYNTFSSWLVIIYFLKKINKFLFTFCQHVAIS